MKEMRSAKMICVTVEIREGALTHRARVTAPSIEQALRIAGNGEPGRRVRLLFPIDPETFIVPGDHERSEAA
jgi:hypothetical protein